jgi:hypothetical protein
MVAIIAEENSAGKLAGNNDSESYFGYTLMNLRFSRAERGHDKILDTLDG